MDTTDDDPDGGDCLIGRPLPWWHRLVPQFAWDAYHHWKSGRELESLWAEPDNQYLLELLLINLRRMDRAQKREVVALVQRQLGIRPLRGLGPESEEPRS